MTAQSEFGSDEWTLTARLSPTPLSRVGAEVGAQMAVAAPDSSQGWDRRAPRF